MSNKVEGDFDFVQELMKNYVSNKALLETTLNLEEKCLKHYPTNLNLFNYLLLSRHPWVDGGDQDDAQDDRQHGCSHVVAYCPAPHPPRQ